MFHKSEMQGNPGNPGADRGELYSQLRIDARRVAADCRNEQHTLVQNAVVPQVVRCVRASGMPEAPAVKIAAAPGRRTGGFSSTHSTNSLSRCRIPMRCCSSSRYPVRVLNRHSWRALSAGTRGSRVKSSEVTAKRIRKIISDASDGGFEAISLSVRYKEKVVYIYSKPSPVGFPSPNILGILVL
jgi:hypothetical protein